MYIYTCRSSKFFLTIEQAVVKGGKVLIEHFPSPMDPALQPVIEIGNNKGGKYTSIANVRALVRIKVHKTLKGLGTRLAMLY